MDASVIASLVGFGSAVVTTLVAAVITRRRLRQELHTAYHGDLARKQVAACEALWSALESTSFSPGSTRVVARAGDVFTVNCGAARELVEQITKVFYSSHGLFFSRQVRKPLSEFREFLCDEFLPRTSDSQCISISKTEADKFRRKATALRIALRTEIGVADLKAAHEITKDA